MGINVRPMVQILTLLIITGEVLYPLQAVPSPCLIGHYFPTHRIWAGGSRTVQRNFFALCSDIQQMVNKCLSLSYAPIQGPGGNGHRRPTFSTNSCNECSTFSPQEEYSYTTFSSARISELHCYLQHTCFQNVDRIVKAQHIF